MSRPVVLSWDYRGQPDLAELARAVLAVSGGTVHLTAVAETGTDDYALIVADRPYEQVEASEVYQGHWRGEDG